MSDHPMNLAVRFLPELVILSAFGYWPWHTKKGWLRNTIYCCLVVPSGCGSAKMGTHFLNEQYVTLGRLRRQDNSVAEKLILVLFDQFFISG
ncbi:MAG TPA: hypothetical protein PKC72_15860 [Chitinophagaceae bacterium]|nr:hypothetical protein [Chitinophagaceae bacterium]